MKALTGFFKAPKPPKIQEPAPVVNVSKDAEEDVEKRASKKLRTQLLETPGGLLGDQVQAGGVRTMFGN